MHKRYYLQILAVQLYRVHLIVSMMALLHVGVPVSVYNDNHVLELRHLNGIQPSLMFIITLSHFLLEDAKMSAVIKVYSYMFISNSL